MKLVTLSPTGKLGSAAQHANLGLVEAVFMAISTDLAARREA
jgi:hypothetical protein